MIASSNSTIGSRTFARSVFSRELFPAAIVCWLFLIGASSFGQNNNPDPPDENLPVTTDEDSDEYSDLPKLDTLVKPSYEELMTGQPIDWLVLSQDRVLRVEPVVPRPQTVEKINEQMKKMAPRSGQTETETAKRKRLALLHLPVTLLEGDEREYTIQIKYIKSIIYHEDLMLERIDLLLKEGAMRKAYELLAALEERDDAWPGLAARRESILFVDSQTKFERNQPEHALALSESLHQKNAKYNGLSELVGKIVDRLTQEAVDQSDYRRARFFIRRGQQMFPEQEKIVRWVDTLSSQTRELIQQAVQAEQSGKRRDAIELVEQAARVWPTMQELISPYNRIANRWQRLRVGVVDLPRPLLGGPSLVQSYADQRGKQLTSAPFFQPTRLDDRIVRFRSRFLSDWEPRDLGHSIHLKLRPWTAPADSQPLLTAFDLSQMFADRMFPGNPKYDARLGAMIERVEIEGPFDVQVHLAQVPLRPEVLLSLPAEIQTEKSGDSESTDAGPASLGGAAGDFPFVPETGLPDQRIFRRAFVQPDGLPDYQVAEVIEKRYSNYEGAIQALIRGDVLMLPRVPMSAVRRLEPRKEFFTQAYAVPTSHFVLLNHQRPVMKLRSFRRALVYAVDRSKVLEEVFLHEPPGELGRLLSAPWSSKSYAYSPFVAPHQFDLTLAFSLTQVASRELKSDLPTLKFFCPADPEIITACQAMVAAWKRIGLSVTLIPVTDKDPRLDAEKDEWDMVYRAQVLPEPAFDLAPLMTFSPSTDVEAYRHLPAWLRRDLLELDRAGDWNTNTQIMHRLHRQIWAEVEIIPLWELDDRFICRKSVRNIPDRPVSPYQSADRWKVDPWYPRESQQ